MESQDTLEIISLSNYDYILYKVGHKKICLLLTRESGFGVYNYIIEPQFTNLADAELTKDEIYALLEDYRSRPEEFVKNHKEVLLDSNKAKLALEFWEKSIIKVFEK